MTDHHHGASGAHDSHDHGSHDNSKYVYVFIALCVLTSMSFLTYTDFWPFKGMKEVTWLFMMAVSCAKASLVMMVFMHLWWEADWKYVLTIPASIMSIFLMLALVPDVGLRTRTYSDARMKNVAQPSDVSNVVNQSKHVEHPAGH